MNFYRALRDLDHIIVGSGLCSIPTGRAYIGAQGPYADKIHVFPFAEKLQNFNSEASIAGGLYMGPAGLINFGHLARIKPTHAILFDVNPFQIIFWNIVLSAIRSNDRYDDFCNALNYAEIMTRQVIDRRLSHIEFSASESWTQALSHDDGVSLTRKNFATIATSFSSYLKAIDFGESDYAFIKNMVDRNRIGTLTIDLFDRDAWEQLSLFLRHAHQKDHHIPCMVSTLYTSSIMRFASETSDWTGRRLKETSIQGLSYVLDPEKSIVVDHQGHYTAASFYTKTREKELWPSSPPIRNSRESAQEFGAARSVQPSIL